MKSLYGNILATALAALFLATSSAVAQEQGDIKVTLLGTGGPEMFPDRLGISTLVEANGQRLLFDVGRATRRRSEWTASSLRCGKGDESESVSQPHKSNSD